MSRLQRGVSAKTELPCCVTSLVIWEVGKNTPWEEEKVIWKLSIQSKDIGAG